MAMFGVNWNLFGRYEFIIDDEKKRRSWSPPLLNGALLCACLDSIADELAIERACSTISSYPNLAFYFFLSPLTGHQLF